MLDAPEQIQLPLPSHFKQDEFLSGLIMQKKPVCIFLKSGVKLQGILTGFDVYTVFLQSGLSEQKNIGQQMIYKHAISTISTNMQVMAPVKKYSSASIEVA